MNDLPVYFPHCTDEETNREESQPAKVHGAGRAGSRYYIPLINFSGGINVVGPLMSFLETI